MKHQDKPNPMLKRAANLAQIVARIDTTVTCGMIVNQPKEPENMAARLRAMKAKERR